MRKKNPRKDELQAYMLEQGVPKPWVRFFLHDIRTQIKLVLKSFQDKEGMMFLRSGSYARELAEESVQIYTDKIKPFES